MQKKENKVPLSYMNLYLLVFIFLTMGIICSMIAKKRNRNPVIWFFIGVFFGMLGLIILYILPASRQKSLQTSSLNPSSTPAAPSETQDLMNKMGDSNPSPQPSRSNVFWYYLDKDDKQIGPMSFNGLKKAFTEKKITSNHYVWNETLEDWKHFKDLPEYQSLNKPETNTIHFFEKEK